MNDLRSVVFSLNSHFDSRIEILHYEFGKVSHMGPSFKMTYEQTNEFQLDIYLFNFILCC